MNDGGIPPPTPPENRNLVLMFIEIGGGGGGYCLLFSLSENAHTYVHTQTYRPIHAYTHTHTKYLYVSCIFSWDEGWLCEEWLSNDSTLHIHTRERGREWGRREMGGDLSEIDSRHRHSQFINLPFLFYFLLLYTITLLSVHTYTYIPIYFYNKIAAIRGDILTEEKLFVAKVLSSS